MKEKELSFCSAWVGYTPGAYCAKKQRDCKEMQMNRTSKEMQINRNSKENQVNR